MRASFATLMIAVAGCTASGGSTLMIEPREPPRGDVPRAPDVGVSTLSMRFRVPLEELRTAVDMQLPAYVHQNWPDNTSGHHASLRPSGGTCLVYFAKKTGPASLTIVGGEVVAEAPYGFGMIAALDLPIFSCGPLVSCGDKSNHVPAVPLRLRVGWPISVDERFLIADIRNLGTQFDSPCRVVFGIHDATSTVRDRIDPVVDRALVDVNRRLRELVNLRARAEQAWLVARATTKVGDGLWLQVDPLEIDAQLGSEPGAITIDVRMRAAIGITHSQERPAALPARDMPPLGRDATVGASTLSVDTEFPFDALERGIATALESDVKAGTVVFGGHTLHVRGVKLLGHQGRVLGRVDVDGDVRGRLFFWGVPTYDATTQSLYFADVDFTKETSDLLVNAVDRFRHGELRGKLAARLRWSAGAALVKATADVQRAINVRHGPLQLSGQVSASPRIEVLLDRNALVLRTIFEGRIEGQL
jgi:Domain of unknown function (DUF4403)